MTKSEMYPWCKGCVHEHEPEGHKECYGTPWECCYKDDYIERCFGGDTDIFEECFFNRNGSIWKLVAEPS